MSNTRPRIAVLIPALNEEVALPHVLADLPREAVEEVVVVDNGSSDRTAEVARASGATVLSEPPRSFVRAPSFTASDTARSTAFASASSPSE